MFGCSHNIELKKVKLLGEVQGTYYSIIYYDETGKDFQMEIDSILNDFDNSVSLWVPNSILSKVNNNDNSVVLDSYFVDNFEISKDVANKTNGAFDFTIGTLINAWGFGWDHNKTIDNSKIDSLLQLTGHEKVRLQNGKVIKDNSSISFDFNAVAQGFSVDVIAFFLQDQGITNYLIDIGGEVKAKGQKPDGSKWKIGIEKPAENKTDNRDLKAIAQLTDISIATSGNYRKFYVENGIKYSHTINPKTGYPAKNTLLSVSVLHKSTAYADAFATSFMVMGFEKAKLLVENNDDLEAFFIVSNKDGNYETYATKGFKEVITKEFE
jgi:thiamine biosynthesis lipoprotein